MRMGRATSRLRLVILLGVTIGVSMGMVGCRTTEADVHKWGETLNGPRRLEAVVRHDKYSVELRTEAAMTLVRMKPRNGRRVGIEGGEDPEQVGLLGVLASLPKEARGSIIGRMIPLLAAKMKAPVPPGSNRRLDDSYPYKDAAFALLTREQGSLITREEDGHRLREALTVWVSSDFPNRLEEPSQIYGVEQVLRLLGPQGVEGLPALMEPAAPKLERMAEFIAELGDEATRVTASQRLVDVASYTASAKWLADKTPVLQKANTDSKLNPTEKQFSEQLATYQDEELIRLFGSMKKLGRAPIVSYFMEFAATKTHSDKQRAAAVAALEGNLDKNDTKQLDGLFTLASAEDTPDNVRDLTLRRLSELPRKLVIDRLYGLFENSNWKVRWLAAELALKMSDTSQFDEFMTRLGPIKTMAMTEPIRYGAVLADMKGPVAPSDLAAKYLAQTYPIPVRLTALGWYFHHGSADDQVRIRPDGEDKAPAPKCAPEAKDCEWKCDMITDGKTESKDIITVGDFVRYCVLAEIDRRLAANSAKK
jgi:hypothetical protein